MSPDEKHSNKNYNNGYFGNGHPLNGYRGEPNRGRSEAQDPDEIDLKRLFYTLWNNKWIIIASVVLCSVLAGVVAYSVTPIYRSEGSMLIKDSGNKLSSMGGDNGLASMLSSTYGIGMGSTIANELQILQSRNLSMEMADSMMQLQVMRNGRQFPVLFTEYPDDSTMVEQDVIAKRLRDSFSFSRSDREADLVTVAFESPSPLEAAFAVNLSMDIYSDLSTRQNRLAANAAVEFLENERTRIEDRLNTVEQRLREFMNREQLVQVDAQTEKLIERMAEMESRRQEARVKLVAVTSAIEQYEERLNSIKPGLAGQYADAIGPNMTRLQYQLAELEIEKMQLLANNPGLQNQETPTGKLAELNDKITFYRDRIEELTGNLVEQSDQYLGFLGSADGNVAETITELNRKLIELKIEQQQYQSQVEVLDEQLAEQRAFFDNLPDNMIELARLKRDVTINEELYLTVSKQFAEMSLWEQTQFGLGRPVDDGFIPEDPVQPNKKLYVLVGFILGGILSVGYIFVREAFNTKIDSIEKLKEYELPLLSVIPSFDKFVEEHHDGKDTVTLNGQEVSTSLVSLLMSDSAEAESFRRLQSNIIFANPDKDLKTILVTSSRQGEGKTTVASNLAIVMAEAGYKVAMVDADLRRPRIHKQFGLNWSPGVFDVVFEGATVQEALKPTLLDNLHVLPAGQEPPNAAALTQSSAFMGMIDELKETFDYVIIDTPPFGIITDASALIRKTDGVIAVARFNQTNEPELEHLLENLDQVHAHVLGTVLTDFNYKQTRDYRYNFYYHRDMYEDYAKYDYKGTR
ncbi:polysaccharide biosynthesis tyrosine autokinase [Balneolaceae bacterium YR4-1]|uniref:non-specific protein-tyrosine kinase n=1 Tax=Halalkalibaculum roseum TaxID=2709311 RepID=A0A6M1SXS3_9BACT|nr:polysaccharide biosynthesis tyrosine autokinase [Halalkalibaculum roseum]NGP75934.1 polysaccharide biosynthesis tyrosine autokinase [Halalkalibaculum roseum]